jgi:hypothetical protein
LRRDGIAGILRALQPAKLLKPARRSDHPRSTAPRPDPPPARLPACPEQGRAAWVAAVLAGFLVAGCVQPPRVLPLRLASEPGPARQVDRGQGYEAAVRRIALELDALGLPLPPEITVLVYPTRRSYTAGLVEVGGIPAARAAEIAGYSVGLAQRRRLFINDEALRDVPPGAWLGILAHELTHVAQYEMSGGRRGRSEQWLREGMADWVACRVLERLGEGKFHAEREGALRAVAQDLSLLDGSPLDLVDLGRPLGWEARHLAAGDRLTYRLAFLLTEELVRRSGLDRVVGYFRAFADSEDRFGHFQRAFGLSLGEFETDALARLRRELPVVPDPAAGKPGRFSESAR